jgi:hypothetical protein
VATLSRKSIWLRGVLALTILFLVLAGDLAASVGTRPNPDIGLPGTFDGGQVDTLVTGPDPGDHDGDPDECDRTQLPIVIWIGSFLVIRI